MSARLVKNINPSGSSSPNSLISVEGLIYFGADISASDDTNEGQTINDDPSLDPDDDPTLDDILDDIEDNPDEGTDEDGDSDDNDSSDPDSEVPSDTSIPTERMGLYKSDGSEGGTVLLKAFNSVNSLVEVSGEIYFVAGTDNGFELWKSDGTSSGTQRVKVLYPFADPAFPPTLFEIDNVLYFSAKDPTADEGKYPEQNGYELWRWEGSGVGTRFFRNLIPDVSVISDPRSEDDQGNIVVTVTTEIYERDSFPREFVGINGSFYFVAYSTARYTFKDSQNDVILGGLELWFSDGTESGTRPININQQTYTYYLPRDGEYAEAVYDSPTFGFGNTSSSSFPRELTTFNQKVYFILLKYIYVVKEAKYE